jgi:two-component system cell cycle sensor histidine kinase/response regulator CckA
VTKKILVVDDEADMVATCVRLLRSLGYICLTAKDAAEAVALLDAERPDLLLTDLKLPVLDGLTVVRHARGLRDPVPVVVFTGYVSPDSRRASLEAGAAAYLKKPFTAEELRETVRRVLDLDRDR